MVFVSLVLATSACSRSSYILRDQSLPSSSAPVASWAGTKHWGGPSGYTENYNVLVASDSSIINVGYADVGINGNSATGIGDLIIVKYASSGSLVWTKQYGIPTKYIIGYGAALDASGNIFVSGVLSGPWNGQAMVGTTDLFVAKFDSGGNLIWVRITGAPGVNTTSTALTIDSGGNAIAVGYTSGNYDGNTLTGTSNIVAIKYSTLGVKAWSYQATQGAGVSAAFEVITDSLNDIYIAGRAQAGSLNGQATTGNDDAAIVKLSSSGVHQWTRLTGPAAAQARATSIVISSTGDILLAGTTDAATLNGQAKTGATDAFFMTYSPAGVRLSTQLYGGAGATLTAVQIKVATDGSVVMAGHTNISLQGQPYTGSGGDLFVVKFNSGLVRQWTRMIGATWSGYFGKVAVNATGDVFGSQTAYNDVDGVAVVGNGDVYLTKYNTSGVKQ